MKLTTNVDISDSYNDTSTEIMDDTSACFIDSSHTIDDVLSRVENISSQKESTTQTTDIDLAKLNKDTHDKTKLEAVLELSQDDNDYLKLLLDGTGICGDSRNAYAKPEWLDMEKFQRGREFQKKYSFGIMYSQMISLMILFAFQGGLEPLIYTGKSHTPFKAFKRYLSTALRVKTWYEGDIWNDENIGYKNMKLVRTMHEGIRKRLMSTPKEELANKVTLDNEEGSNPMWTTLHEDISEDFKSIRPAAQSPFHGEKQVYVNQTDMAVTQFGFIGLILLFPKMFGIHNASLEDLDGFAHFWRAIGFLLGMEDRFNLCTGDLAVVTRRCQDLLDNWVKPAFGHVSRDWIHMSRCMVEGISYYVAGTTFEVIILYLCKVLGIQAPRLAASLKFWQRVMFRYTCFLYAYVLRLPGMWSFHNWLIGLAMKRAQSYSPERMSKLENKDYLYKNQPRLVCTRL